MSAEKGVEKKPRWRRWLKEGAFLVLVLTLVSLWQGRHLLGSGEPAPDVALQTLDGEVVQLSDLRGKKVLLYFWAPWCGVCKAVKPNLRWMASSDRVEVVSVASSYGELDTVLQADPADFSDQPLLGDEAATEAFAVRAYPTFYVIDEEGRIQRSFMGYTTRLGLWLRTL